MNSPSVPNGRQTLKVAKSIVDELPEIEQRGYDIDSKSDDKDEEEEALPQLVVVSDIVASRSTPLPDWMPNQIIKSQIQAADIPALNTHSQTNIVSIMDEVILLCAQTNPNIQIDPKQVASQKYPMELLCEMKGSALDAETDDLLEYQHLLRHPQ